MASLLGTGSRTPSLQRQRLSGDQQERLYRLRRMAREPHLGARGRFQRLDYQDQLTVLWEMARIYGDRFAQSFLHFARQGQLTEDMVIDTPDEIYARAARQGMKPFAWLRHHGYRLTGMPFGHREYVHSSGLRYVWRHGASVRSDAEIKDPDAPERRDVELPEVPETPLEPPETDTGEPRPRGRGRHPPRIDPGETLRDPTEGLEPWRLRVYRKSVRG